MCEPTDWLGAIGELAWAISSLEELFQRGSCQREIYRNATDGIQERLRWIQAKAKAELKREKVYNGTDLTLQDRG